jgi:DnaK suppressor protein
MTDHSATANMLRTRLVELTGDIAEVEAARRAPLDADFSEQAGELAGQDALGGIENGKINEADKIRSALVRIENGTYGICTKCGRDIPEKRLAAVPTATTCVEHAPA